MLLVLLKKTVPAALQMISNFSTHRGDARTCKFGATDRASHFINRSGGPFKDLIITSSLSISRTLCDSDLEKTKQLRYSYINRSYISMNIEFI